MLSLEYLTQHLSQIFIFVIIHLFLGRGIQLTAHQSFVIEMNGALHASDLLVGLPFDFLLIL